MPQDIKVLLEAVEDVSVTDADGNTFFSQDYYDHSVFVEHEENGTKND